MHEVGGYYPLDTILSEMNEAGYEGTEIGNKFPSNAKEIKITLEKYNLELASSWHSTFFLTNSFKEESENIKNKCSLLSEAGARVVNIAECSGSIHNKIKTALHFKPVCNEDQYSILSDSLNKAGEICKSFGLNLAFHHHMGTYIQNYN